MSRLACWSRTTDTDAVFSQNSTTHERQDGNGIVDHPEYTVWDAWEIYENMMGEKTISRH